MHSCFESVCAKNLKCRTVRIWNTPMLLLQGKKAAIFFILKYMEAAFWEPCTLNKRDKQMNKSTLVLHFLPMRVERREHENKVNKPAKRIFIKFLAAEGIWNCVGREIKTGSREKKSGAKIFWSVSHVEALPHSLTSIASEWVQEVAAGIVIQIRSAAARAVTLRQRKNVNFVHPATMRV